MSNTILEQSVIWPDIESILNSEKKPIKKLYRGLIHTEKEDIPIVKISTIDVIRDYIDKVGEQINIEFLMPLGDYIYKLYPYRNNLEVSLKIIDLKEITTSQESNSVISVEKYKAIFIPNENEVFNTREKMNSPIEALNIADVVLVKLQLLDISLEPIRIKTTHGIYSKVTLKDVISSILINESSKILINGKPSISKLDIVEPDNTDIKNNIVIPHGTHILSLPSFLHSKMGGVYNGGIGTYIQSYNNEKSWFIYPIFDINRFDTDVEKAIFYSLPAKKFSGIERTYNKVGKILNVIAASDNNYMDSADTDYMNSGSGFRHTEAKSFMKKPVEMTEEGPVAVRHKINHEIVFDDRADGLNYAPISNTRISSNPFIERSTLALKNLARIDLIWDNADISLIYPGMPCKFIFLHNNKPIELKGTIIALHAFISTTGNTLHDKVYKNKCGLVLLVNKYKLELISKTNPTGEF